MKQITSGVTFSYQYNQATLVNISPTPILVADDIAEHLVSIYGGLITVSEPDTTDTTEDIVNVVPTEDANTPSIQATENTTNEIGSTEAPATAETEDKPSFLDRIFS